MSINDVKRAVMQTIMRNLYFKIFFLITLTYTVLGFLLVPYLIQHYLPTIVHKTLGTHATLYKTSFNPYTFQLSLNHLVVQDDKAKRLVSFNTLEVDFDVDDLLEGKLLFKNIYLKHLKVDMRIDVSGRYNFQHIIDHITANSEDDEVREDTNSSLIGIRIPKLHIDDARILFEDQSMGEPFSVKTRPFDFELRDFSTVLNEAGKLHFMIATHESGSIQSTASISLQPFGIKGDFSIRDFNINKLYSYIKESVDFKLDGHRVNAVFDYDVSYRNGHLDLDVIGSNINIDRLHYSDLNHSIGFQTLQSSINRIHMSKIEDQFGIDSSGYQLHLDDLNYSNTIGTKVSLKTLESNLTSVTFKKATHEPIHLELDTYALRLQTLAYQDQAKQAIALSTIKIGFDTFDMSMEEESSLNTFYVTLDDINYKDLRNQLSINTVALKMPKLLVKKDQNISAYITSFRSDKLSLDNRGKKIVRLKKIMVDDLQIDTSYQEYNITKIILDKAHVNMSLYADLTTDFNHLFVPSTDMKKQKKPMKRLKPKLTIKDIRLKNSRFDFKDLRHEPIHLSIKHINTHIKDVTLDERQHIPFSFSHATPSKGDVKGWGVVRLKPFRLNLNLKAKQVDLRPYMPYVKPFVNLDMKSSYLSSTIKLNLNKGKRMRVSVKGDLSLQKIDLYHAIKKERLMRVDEIRIDAFAYQKNYLKINKILIHRPYNKIAIDENRSTNFDGLIPKAQLSSPQNKKKVSQQKESNFVYMVGEVRVNEGEMDFSDLSLPLMFQTHIDHLDGDVVAISSDPNETMHIKLDGVVDTYGIARIAGSLISAEPTKSTNITVDFKNIDVTAFSPYSGKFIGRKIQNGKLWLDLGYKIDNSVLKSYNKIKMKNLELGEEVESDEASDLPVGLAIALLKDGDGYIDVSVPVEGNVDDPNFKYGAAAWKAVGNLVVGIVSSPFKFLGSTLGIDAEEMAKISFDLGSAKLLAPEKEKLDNLINVFATRPELGLRLTPSYLKEEDTKALQRQKLYALALEKFDNSSERTSKHAFIKKLYLKNFSKKAYELMYEKSKAILQADEVLDERLFREEVAALTAIQVITVQELNTLALQRSKSIKQYLYSKGFEQDRITQNEKVKTVEEVEDNGYVMALEVEIAK